MTVTSSIGDITIDSVKDHIGSGEEVTNRISGMTVTKTIITTTVNQGGEVITSSSNSTTTTSTTQAENS